MARSRTNRKTARITVTLEQSVYDRLCALARRDDVSVAWVVRRAVSELIGDRQPANDRFTEPMRRRGGRQK